MGKTVFILNQGPGCLQVALIADMSKYNKQQNIKDAQL